MKVTVSYVTGKLKIYTNILKASVCQNASGTLVLLMEKASGSKTEILLSIISSYAVDAAGPAQHVNCVIMQ